MAVAEYISHRNQFPLYTRISVRFAENLEAGGLLVVGGGRP